MTQHQQKKTRNKYNARNKRVTKKMHMAQYGIPDISKFDQ